MDRQTTIRILRDLARQDHLAILEDIQRLGRETARYLAEVGAQVAECYALSECRDEECEHGHPYCAVWAGGPCSLRLAGFLEEEES